MSNNSSSPTNCRIYVASLSDYNAGILHGVWIDIDEHTDIKGSLGAITELLKSNTRLEEQAAALKEKLSTIYTRLHTVELTVAASSGSHKWSDRVISLIIGAAITALLVEFK